MNELPAEVLRCQVDSLRAALVKVLDAREKEAKALFSYENAKANFSGRGGLEGNQHFKAMMAASNAEREARTLLLTLRDRPRPEAPMREPNSPSQTASGSVVEARSNEQGPPHESI